MMALLQGVVQFGVLPYFSEARQLSSAEFVLLVLATVCIAAGGYILNDYCDVRTDLVNKPGRAIVGSTLSRKRTLHLYLITTGLGLFLGALLCLVAQKWVLFLLFVAIVAMLNFYSKSLKGVAVLGNLLVSWLVALTLITIALFAIPFAHLEPKVISQSDFARVIWYFIVFAMVLTFLREVVKDLEDIKGDYASGHKTLPIVFGIERTARFASVFGMACLFLIALFTFTAITNHILQGALIMGTVAPLGYVASQLWEARKPEQFGRLSTILKIVMLVGVLLIPFIAQYIAHAQG
ncbi:hypothetical protein EAX61_00220 [Dokdonia sinensis]|uniref:Prenyltransferase n=2 Tax=Dokdonia sinensis TaxID=2479847 RepID=A0A3M0GGP3_9FLAO|nr:hypothetical protein EAX61_00220 [Dokdonia sinensis]